MLEVHVVTGANRHLYERELDEHHQIRHRIYVEELHWRGLTPRSDKREYDQFDLPETVYLLGLEEGRVVAGLRLVPTTGPHLIKAIYSGDADFKPSSMRIKQTVRRSASPAVICSSSGGHGSSEPSGMSNRSTKALVARSTEPASPNTATAAGTPSQTATSLMGGPGRRYPQWTDRLPP